jgi:hypothetical protein
MRSKLYVLFVTLLCALAMFTAQSSAADLSSQVESLRGNYGCITRYADGRSYRFQTHNAMFGKWLRLDATFPAQGGLTAFTAVTFLGFDRAANRWDIVSVNPQSYYTRTSVSSQLADSRWNDEDPADGGRARLHIYGNQHYRFDLDVPMGKQNVTSSTDCSSLR